jgi:hypothetical protein
VRSGLRLVGCVALIACGACSQAAAPPVAKLWTLFDVEALYAGGAPATTVLAPDDGLPGGVLLGKIAGPAVAPDGPPLVIRQGLADGYQISFVTTEVWSNYAQVWMQPAYVPITGWSGGTPQKLVDASGAWHPIFSVGPDSGFYSPFWQIVYFEVPAGTDPGALTSARQVQDGGYPLTPSQGQTMPLVPAGTTGAGTQRTGWLDGTAISFLNFGAATFTWDAANVVAEVPLYYLTLVGSDGAVHKLPSMPTVLGTSPPGAAPVAALTIDGVARYSTYWRVYTAPVPSFARVFAPPGSTAEADLMAIGLSPGTYTAALTAYGADNYAPYVGRVAVNAGDPSTGVAGCFDDPSLLEHDATDRSTCTWLDSQAALEANIDLSASQATEITVTCPVTEVKASAVVPL